jgi:hypothetical protein
MGACPRMVFDGEEYRPKAPTASARRGRREQALAAAMAGNIIATKKRKLLATGVMPLLIWWRQRRTCWASNIPRT